MGDGVLGEDGGGGGSWLMAHEWDWYPYRTDEKDKDCFLDCVDITKRQLAICQ